MVLRALAALALIGLVNWSSPAGAIVMRHDRPSSDYERASETFPALFALYRTRAGHRDCIATMIAAQWAVTAAHCTEDGPFTRALAEAGYRVEVAGQSVMIDRLVRHETADIALLHLAQTVSGVQPLAPYRGDDEQGRTVLIPGWGGVGNGRDGLGVEDGLFRVAENVVDVANETWLTWRFDDPGNAERAPLEREGISGPGDSGGPALIETPEGFAVAGVSSRQRTFGRPEGQYGAEEYFVRVSRYAAWIDATLNAS